MVANTGPVVGAADAGRIFQPFERLTRTSQEGFGLGLAIVASIAAVHGGTIAARPRKGGGLGLTVSIPPPGARPGAPGTPSAERPRAPVPESDFGLQV